MQQTYQRGILKSFSKLVVEDSAVQQGLVKSRVARPHNRRRKEKKEDGIMTSQKVLLTWLIEDENMFSQI